MMSIVAIEQISRVDASVGVFMDVQNTLVNNAFLRWGNDEIKEKYLPSSLPRRWEPIVCPKPVQEVTPLL